MGKKKTITERVKIFYRGPWKAPTRIASENEMQIICEALIECINKKNCTFEVNWNSETISLQLAIGFSSSLRCLRQKRTRAIIFDDTTPKYIAKYLTEFSRGPIIQAHRLFDVAEKLKFKKLMIVSLVEPRIVGETSESDKLQKLCHLMLSNITAADRSFHRPVLDKLPVTGISKLKKEVKKKAKQLSEQSKNKPTCT